MSGKPPVKLLTEEQEYLCVGEVGIKRWELSAIQFKAMDELIRLKCDPEKAQLNAKQFHIHRKCEPKSLRGAKLRAKFPVTGSPRKRRKTLEQ